MNFTSEYYQEEESSENFEAVLRPEIARLIARIEKNIERRKIMLENDVYENKIVVDRVVSSELAGVPGMDKWLQRTRVIKDSYAQQIVMDEWSHGSIRRSDVHNKYVLDRKKPETPEKSIRF